MKIKRGGSISTMNDNSSDNSANEAANWQQRNYKKTTFPVKRAGVPWSPGSATVITGDR